MHIALQHNELMMIYTRISRIRMPLPASELTRLPADDPEHFRTETAELPEQLAERRAGQDRRMQHRRLQRTSPWLDTRSGLDRRRAGRRASDLPEAVSLKV